MKTLKVWYLLTTFSSESLIATRWALLIFVGGKLLRLALFFGFVYFLFSGTKDFLGYGHWQALLFVIVFYFLSAVGQMLFREVYRFRPRILSGEFDYDLIRPVHPILRNIFGGFDLQDLLTMPIFIAVLWIVLSHISFTSTQLLIFLGLGLNGLVLMFTIHLFVAALIIFTPDVDHGLMFYRDLENMARFPIDIYKQPLREILTFIIPIGVIFTFPAKALLGILSWQVVAVSFLVGALSLYLSFSFWNFAVKKYSSASS